MSIDGPSREADLAAALTEAFQEHFHAGDAHLAIAPGRVNLIGEHTDYNDGWALPMAIDRYVGIAFSPRSDRTLRVHTTAFDETTHIDLDGLSSGLHTGWTAYVAGVAWALGEDGDRIAGMDALIDADLPIGAGLSSSAAIEMAVALALCHVSGVDWEPKRMARLGRKADNEYIGIASGPLDQTTSALAREGAALLLDCRTLETRPAPIPEDLTVVAMDTGVRRALTESEYNDRKASCDRAVEVLRKIDPTVQALRDADLRLLAAARTRLDDMTFRRARHVIEENERPLAMVSAFRTGRPEQAGALMDESHRSLRDLYEVSSAELDLVSDLARQHPACHGARLTGAGFGGSAIALVAKDGVEDFLRSVQPAYDEQTGLPSAFFSCRPVGGARLW